MKKYRQSVLVVSMLLSILFLNINAANAFSNSTKEEKLKNSFRLEKNAGFVENKGQVKGFDGQNHPEVKYSLNKGNTSVFILETGIAYQFNKIHFPEGYKVPESSASEEEREKMNILSKQIRTETYRMDMELIGANKNAIITTEGKSEDYINFYTTNTFDVHKYSKIVVHGIYPGIDWVIYNNENGFKYDFVLKANADPSLIKMKFVNQEGLEINKDGSLTLSNSMGSITEQNPISTQNGKTIATAFENNKGVVSFKLGNYNSNEQLTIDPTVVWATYYGDTGGDAGRGCITDPSGNVYMAGYSPSTTGIASGGHQTVYGGGASDAYLVKFNSSGTRLWATYYGGAGNDYGYSCATDALGNVYLCGSTDSPTGIASGGHDNVLALSGSGIDAYLAKFNSAGTRLWATYYGGPGDEGGTACTVDGLNNVYLCGITKSANSIATAGANQTVLSGTGTTFDAFLVKFNAGGTRKWGTYYGGSGDEEGNSCATDASGNVFLAGGTNSVASSVMTLNPHQAAPGGVQDAYLGKFDSLGVRQWSTFYGGATADNGYDCATDASGNVYLAGQASSPSSIATTSGFQNAISGSGTFNAFIAKFNSVGVRQWATYYGAASTIGRGCTISVAGDVYLMGYTTASTLIASGGVQNTPGGSNDAFVVKFNSAGTTRLWGTYYGGTAADYGYAIANNTAGDLYFVGNTSSTSAIALAGHLNTYAGVVDGFLVKLLHCTLSAPTSITGSTTVCSGTSNTYTIAAVAGATSYTWTLPSGWSGTSTTTSITTTAGVASGNITVTANNACGPSNQTTLAITVNTAPLAPGSILGSSPACLGSVNTYSVTAVAGATSYNWTLPGGWSGTSTTNSISATTGVTSGNITVTASNSCGTSTPSTFFVSVGLVPSAPSTISGTSTICSGTTNTYSISAVAGATSYTWTLPSGWSGTSTTTSISATSGTTSGNITVTANNTCGSSGATTFAVTVNPVPATPSGISGTFVLCGGTTNTYSISSVAGATSYTWTLPSGWSGTSTTTSISATAGTTGGNISVVANNACGSSSATTSIAAVENIPSSPLSISGSATICEGTTNTYSISAVAGATSYTWTLPSGWSGASTTTTISATAGTTGGTITVTANNVCGTSSPTTLPVTVNPLPNPAVTSASNTITASQVGATYQWLNCNTGFSAISGQTSQSYTASTNGSYAVQISLGGCSDTSACTVITGIGVNENNLTNAVTLFPNPNSGAFTLNFENTFEQVSVVVINVVGQIVYSNSFENQNQINLNVEGEAGIYFVQIVSNDKEQTLIKLIKQ